MKFEFKFNKPRRNLMSRKSSRYESAFFKNALALSAFFCYNFRMEQNENLCPCGSGKIYGECCEPIIKGTKKAATAEELMRARYSSYVKQEIDFIIDTCESSEQIAQIDRKATEDWSRNSTWHGLRILRTEKGTPSDTEGIVEFEAVYTQKHIRETHHEMAYFKKIGDEWAYSTGELKVETIVREGRKIGRNEPCPCGSGKKYKNCCGKN